MKIIWDQYKFNDYNNRYNTYLIRKCNEINDMNIIES